MLSFLNADPERNVSVAEEALRENADMPDDDGWTRTVLMYIVEAIRDNAGLVCEYRNDDGLTSARVLFPEWVTVTKARNLACRAFCTLRREYRTFASTGSSTATRSRSPATRQ
jgi:predicted DNA-binding transcriptional regulator YafY